MYAVLWEDGMYYTETKGSRWSTQAVSHKTLERAEGAARLGSLSEPGVHEIVWDCTNGPVGVEICRYWKGQRFESSATGEPQQVLA